MLNVKLSCKDLHVWRTSSEHGCRVGGGVSSTFSLYKIVIIFCQNRSLSFFRRVEAKKMRRPNGKDEGRGGKDLQVLQNEYKHMQVNRNAFANESELVRMNDFNRPL